MRTIVVTVPLDAVEIASDRLWTAGARAVEERAGRGGHVELRSSLGTDDDIALERLGPVPSTWAVEFEDVDDEPADTWRQFARPIAIGPRLVIAPAWVEHAARAGESVIRIEPGGSFGLGDHPTTRLSAAATDGLVRPGDRVLDVGCGSGVLSIIAAERGAAQVLSVDVADAAREATIGNAALNDVADRIEASTTPIAAVAGQFDVVLANILAPALVTMAPDLRRLTAEHGNLVVSGVLTGGYDHVVDALRPMRLVAEQHLDGWSALTLVHQER